jgi:uncharacterized iron-regulated protein
MREDLRNAHILVVVLLLGACATAPAPPLMNLPFGDPARRDRTPPLVLDAITATASGELLTPQELAARLAPVSLVFVGESHTSVDVHQAQRRLIEALVGAGRKVMVGLEMFPYTDQAALDRWVQSDESEADFVRDSRWYKTWGYDFRYYRDIFRLARAHRLPMAGVNIPREVITAVRKKGFDKLSADEARHVPVKVDTDSDEHRRLFGAMIGADSHGADGHGGMPGMDFQGMFRAQCTWDAVMAHFALAALEAHPDPRAVMVVLLGSGHVAFGLGVTRQARALTSRGMATVIPMPVLDEDGKPARPRASYADYLWGLPPEPAVGPYPSLGVALAERKDAPHPVVTSVSPGSPAAAAGLLAEDRIVSIDGTDVPDKETFSSLLAGKEWGDGVALVIERGGRRHTVNGALRRAVP